CVIGTTKLGPVTTRLLQVVAEYLVQLERVRPALLEPVRETPMMLGPGRLGLSFVGDVADEEMPEAKAVLARDLRAVRTNQLPADQTSQPCGRLALLGGERLHRAAVEDFTLDSAPLEHATLGRIDLVEARRQQCPQSRRHAHLLIAGDL